MSDSINRVQSIWDKISDVEVTGNGKVQSNYIVEKKPGSDAAFRKYQFGDMKDFADWKEKNQAQYKKNLRKKLTPHQYYITQGQGMERAFTGEYFWTNDVGRYDCVVCTQRLFMYDHKYINRSGFPTFWNSL